MEIMKWNPAGRAMLGTHALLSLEQPGKVDPNLKTLKGKEREKKTRRVGSKVSIQKLVVSA